MNIYEHELTDINDALTQHFRGMAVLVRAADNSLDLKYTRTQNEQSLINYINDLASKVIGRAFDFRTAKVHLAKGHAENVFNFG